jgi:hypothetical protein
LKRSGTPPPLEIDLSPHLAEAVVAISDCGFIELLNPAAEILFRISDAAARGRQCQEVVKSQLCQSECPRETVLATGKPVTNFNCAQGGDGAQGGRRICALSSVVKGFGREGGRVIGDLPRCRRNPQSY